MTITAIGFVVNLVYVVGLGMLIAAVLADRGEMLRDWWDSDYEDARAEQNEQIQRAERRQPPG